MDENTDVLVHDSEEPNPEIAKPETITSDELYANFVPKSRVTNIVKEQRALAADKVRREMEELHANEIEKLKASQSNSIGGMDQSLPVMQEEARKVFQQELEKLRQQEADRLDKAEHEHVQQATEKAVKDFYMKMAAGKEKFPELEEALNNFDLEAFEPVALIAGQMDNAPEIMMELSRSPEKAARILETGRASGRSALQEMQKLSKSIAKNQEALEDNVKTNAPLSRLKSSSVGADGGKMSLKDFKNADYNIG